VAHGESDSTETKDASANTERPLPIEAPVIMLQPYTFVENPPPLCFGVSLSLWKDGNTGLVTAMYIDKVKPDSSAEEHGLGPRTRIYRINDQSVEEMVASFNGDTELNKIFIDRQIGSRITIEAIPEGASKPKTITLVEKAKATIQINVWD